MKRFQILIFTIFLLSSCTEKKQKNTTYAKKQYFLGHDYFVRHIKALREVDRLRFENNQLEKKISNISLKNGQNMSVVNIRSNKKLIRKNLKQIRNKSELAKRYLGTALKELKKAVIANNTHYQAHFELGLIYLKKATSIIDRAKRKQCLSADEMEEKKGNAGILLNKSKKHFLVAAKDKELTSKSYNNLSAIALHFNEYDNAIEYSRKTLKDLVYSETYVANANMGWAYYHLEKYRKAKAKLKEALMEESKYCLARYRLARVYFEQNKLKLAAREFKKTIDQGPPCSGIQEAYLYFGLSLVQLNQTSLANYIFKRCLLVQKESCVAQKCRRNLKIMASDNSSPETE
ncbi:MAG: tetratricopeptide repeat protein [Myxococcota bacterium]